MERNPRLAFVVERALGIAFVILITLSFLAYSSIIWWAKPTLAALVFVVMCLTLLRGFVDSGFCFLRGPMGALGLAACGLAVFQLAPLPRSMAVMVSPRAKSFTGSACLRLWLGATIRI